MIELAAGEANDEVKRDWALGQSCLNSEYMYVVHEPFTLEGSAV